MKIEGRLKERTLQKNLCSGDRRESIHQGFCGLARPYPAGVFGRAAHCFDFHRFYPDQLFLGLHGTDPHTLLRPLAHHRRNREKK